MRLLYAIGLTMTAATASAESTSAPDLNGWYPCSGFTFSDQGNSTGQIAECAMYSAPLCHPGICEAPASAHPKVDIFFKRLSATKGNPETAINAWLLQGGPGDSSTAMEIDMLNLHRTLQGSVNVYTMDHRGTGRSTKLECVASQVSTSGSPEGGGIGKEEVPACAKDLHFKYGDLASFSVTSAAADLSTFISKHTNDANTIVYGVSYGTNLVERLIHLAPPKVTGYVLDSPFTASGAAGNEFMFASNWENNFGEVADTFLALCDDDEVCKARFEPKGLNGTVQNLLQKYDNYATTCSSLIWDVHLGRGEDSRSFVLRQVLAALLKDPYLRTLIPPLVYRLDRCGSEDVDVVGRFVKRLNERLDRTKEDDALASLLLYYVIMFSEMWEIPTPSKAELEGHFTNQRMADLVYPMISEYCLYSNDNSTACADTGSGYEAHGFTYKRDQYWNESATIPPQASVLLITGKLDPQTTPKYGEYLFTALDGDEKELIEFDYATHASIASTRMNPANRSSETCGAKLLASYVHNEGNLKLLDKSCVAEMPAFNLTAPSNYLNAYFGTDEAYDGLHNGNFSLNPNLDK